MLATSPPAHGKTLRLGRVAPERSERMFLVPLDHSVTAGPIASKDGAQRIIETVSRNGADGVVIHSGRVRFIDPDLFHDLSLIVHLSASTAQAPDSNEKVLVSAVEQAVALGADMASVHVNLGADTESTQLADLGRVAARCTEWGMPLMAMIYPRGPRITDSTSPDLVAHAASIAADLGADVVKTTYTGSIDTMSDVVDTCPIPLVVAGGPQVDDDSAVASSVAAMMRSGAAGVAVGRNVFQARDVATVTRQIASVVHDGPAGQLELATSEAS